MTVAITFLALLFYYTPSLCVEQPVNCYDPLNPFKLAAGNDAREWYGRGLACPMEYELGETFHLPALTGYPAQSWTCVDRGGAIIIDDEGYVRLDILTEWPIVTGVVLATVEFEIDE